MIVDEKDYLEHFGKLGMKWGIRSSPGKSGVDRATGAKLDRNARKRSRLTKSIAGSGHSRSLNTAQLFRSKEKRKAILGKKLKDLNSQDARIKSGKQTTMDKLQTVGGVSMAGLVVSRRPSSSGNTPSVKQKTRPQSKGKPGISNAINRKLRNTKHAQRAREARGSG